MRVQLTKITLAASIALAIAFTFNACSSDEGKGNPTPPLTVLLACEEGVKFSNNYYCWEVYTVENNEDLSMLRGDCAYAGTIVDKCPENPTLECWSDDRSSREFYYRLGASCGPVYPKRSSL